MTGDFRLIRGSHILIDAQSVTVDSLIPRIEDGDEIDISRVRWVLVIEKEVCNTDIPHLQHQYAKSLSTGSLPPARANKLPHQGTSRGRDYGHGKLRLCFSIFHRQGE